MHLTHSQSNKSGWVLVYVLVFVIIIQTAALSALSILKYNMKSGTTFHRLLGQTHAAEMKQTPPETSIRTLDAPQGWDHAVFNTEFLEKTWGKECSFFWRAQLREQPVISTHEPSLSIARPYIIVLIDDCQNMIGSCGQVYQNEKIYLERPDGEIIPVPYRDDVTTSLYSSEGTYFRGDYGNSYFSAPDTNGFGGTISCWAYTRSYIKDLIEGLDMCEVALATTSQGLIEPFTHDMADLLSTLETLHPIALTSPVSESLVQLLDDFPDDCATEKHIIVATSGIAVDDGNLPGWLQDFDNDANVQDCFVEGAGSHCLDDVAAYASTLDIHVNVAGPDTSFLKDVAQKGGGAYMSAIQSILPIQAYVCQERSLMQNTRRFLTNKNASFDPGWLSKTSAACYQAGPYDPFHLAVLPFFAINGPATSQFTSGSSLFCSTSRDCLVSIDISSSSLDWIIHGIGGKIIKREDMIVAGPNLYGYVHALSEEPKIVWRQPGDFFVSSLSSVYIAREKTITSLALNSGMFLTETSTASDISLLRYDPCPGLLLAATNSGTVYIFNQDLDFQDILVTNLAEAICDIHTFSRLKNLNIIACSSNSVMCTTPSEFLWSKDLENGSFLNAVVMDFKVYITTWNRIEGCEGMDTGRSYLTVIDAVSGEKLKETMLFKGRAFGPLIDLPQKEIEYTAWDMNVYEEDISEIEGISYCPLGSMRIHSDQ
jgi:hypothetical protein